MDTASLSSNWKRLQEKLGTNNDRQRLVKKQGLNGSSTAGNALKRKHDSRHRSSTSDHSKKRKISTSAGKPGAKRKMGSYLSTAGSEGTRADLKDNDSVQAAKPLSAAVAGKYIALDCEMVGTTNLTPLAIPSHNRFAPPGAPPEYSILARVSMTNYVGDTIYDAYVLPPAGVQISNYRTQWSGITSSHLSPTNTTTSPISFENAQKEVSELLKGRILVGHALNNDLEVLGLTHPRRDIRDTSRYQKYRDLTATMGKNGKMGKARTPSLKRLASEVLGLEIQEGKGHSSIEDAATAMLLFQREKNGFELEVTRVYGRARKLTPGTSVKAHVGAARPTTNRDAGTEESDVDETVEDGDEASESLIDESVLDDDDDDDDEEQAALTKDKKKKRKKKKKAKSRTKR